MSHNHQYVANQDLFDNILIKQKELQELLVDHRNDRTLINIPPPSMVPSCYVYNVNHYNNYLSPPTEQFGWRPILPYIQEQSVVPSSFNYYCAGQQIPQQNHQQTIINQEQQCQIPLPNLNNNMSFNNDSFNNTKRFRIIDNLPVMEPISLVEQQNVRPPRPILGISKNCNPQNRKPTFFKKFPVRTHNIFNGTNGGSSFTYSDDAKCSERQDIEITFESLRIGPKFEIKSEMTKILEKYSLAFEFLNNLSMEKCTNQLMITNDNETVSLQTNKNNCQNYLLCFYKKVPLFEYFNHFYKLVCYEYDQSTIEIMTKVRLIVSGGGDIGLKLYKRDNINISNETLKIDAQNVIESFRLAIDAYQECRTFQILTMDSSMVLTNQNEINLLMEILSKIITDIRKVSTFIWILCKIYKRQQKHINNSTSSVPQTELSLLSIVIDKSHKDILPIERNDRQRSRNTFIGI